MNLKENLIQLLQNQKEIFGDDLYTLIEISEIKYNKEVERTLVSSEKNIKKEKKEQNPTVQNLTKFDSILTLDEFNNKINTCQLCGLSETRNKFVFGEGNPNADLMLIGEAPGAEEDKSGIPFVGRAGKLLNDILIAIGFKREDVFIANILKCRPPNNRDPLPSEREVCKPYLYKQIDLIKPKVILCLGKVAANVLLNNDESLTKMRANVYEITGIKTMVTYHPAALLRNPNWKRPTWEDVQKVKKIYDELHK
ncbi:MAG: uracil-DNA glycosylase [Ignavibacteriales bacterium CG18_big_fil_WC_8_21_14_2_50_31_20]|nr:MAG: uracil-DNA glycosylase [Ignavibacteriales bacterium CG18_big_fil_WC_8_21_14_2_50_31_20]